MQFRVVFISPFKCRLADFNRPGPTIQLWIDTFLSEGRHFVFHNNQNVAIYLGSIFYKNMRNKSLHYISHLTGSRKHLHFVYVTRIHAVIKVAIVLTIFIVFKVKTFNCFLYPALDRICIIIHFLKKLLILSLYVFLYEKNWHNLQPGCFLKF